MRVAIIALILALAVASVSADYYTLHVVRENNRQCGGAPDTLGVTKVADTAATNCTQVDTGYWMKTSATSFTSQGAVTTLYTNDACTTLVCTATQTVGWGCNAVDSVSFSGSNCTFLNPPAPTNTPTPTPGPVVNSSVSSTAQASMPTVAQVAGIAWSSQYAMLAYTDNDCKDSSFAGAGFGTPNTCMKDGAGSSKFVVSTANGTSSVVVSEWAASTTCAGDATATTTLPISATACTSKAGMGFLRVVAGTGAATLVSASSALVVALVAIVSMLSRQL